MQSPGAASRAPSRLHKSSPVSPSATTWQWGWRGGRPGLFPLPPLGPPPPASRPTRRQPRAKALLEHVDLGSLGDTPADALAAGLRRKLEIARALATDPLLLMLDEPAAGLSPVEITTLDRQLVELRAHGGPAIILVEHH